MGYMINDEAIEEFRDGIFALRTRRFGTVAEIMIKKLYNLEESSSLAFDKRDVNTNDRIEVKLTGDKHIEEKNQEPTQTMETKPEIRCGKIPC